MTAPTNPTDGAPATPGTAVAGAPAAEPAKKSATAEALEAMSPEDRADIMRRRMANLTTALIASTNWGKGMDVDTAKAVSDWGQRNGVDVTKEIFILGGNIYLNAEFYLNRLATLIERGRVLDWRQSFVNIDPRLDADNPIDRAEISRRREMRIRFSIPDTATAAVVTELELVTAPGMIIYGVKWAPRHPKDSVGESFPQESALTRSARRCLKQAVRYLPEIARYVEGAEEDAAMTVTATLQEAAKRRHEIAESAAKQISAPIQPVRSAEYVEPVSVAAPTNVPQEDPYTGAASAPLSIDGLSIGKPAAAARSPLLTPPADAEVIDDLDLLSPAERAEYDARKRERGA